VRLLPHGFCLLCCCWCCVTLLLPLLLLQKVEELLSRMDPTNKIR
jgi:hypothetical protein